PALARALSLGSHPALVLRRPGRRRRGRGFDRGRRNFGGTPVCRCGADLWRDRLGADRIPRAPLAAVAPTVTLVTKGPHRDPGHKRMFASVARLYTSNPTGVIMSNSWTFTTFEKG